MKILKASFRSLLGLFVDDGALAMETLGVVILAALSATLLPNQSLAGAILLFGCIGVLLINTARSRAG